MFLAIKEMRYAKLRYGLIIGIMFLIAYVVFMLTGLASGLSEEFKKAIVDWKAQEIVLSEDANKVFVISSIDERRSGSSRRKRQSAYWLIQWSSQSRRKGEYLCIRDDKRCVLIA